ncbi:hypothetical protein ACWGIB_05730 [Streptomyces xiamenensis]
MFHARVLPPAGVPVRLWRVVAGSALPIVLWTGNWCFACFVMPPVAGAVVAVALVAVFTLGVLLRRRVGHTVRCAVYGAFATTLDKALDGF